MKLSAKHILLLFVSALLLELSFAPFNQCYLAFFALVPLFYVLERTKKAFIVGMIWGIFYNIFSIHWLALNSGTYWWVATFSMLLASLFLALNYGLIAWLFRIIQNKKEKLAWIFLPFIWVAIEFLRSFGTFGFSWLALGHSQAHNTAYLQIADIGGVFTVSLFILLTNLFLYLLYKSFSKKRLIALIIIIAIPFIYGSIMLNTTISSDKELNFRIAQPNIPAKEKWLPENRLPIIMKLDSLSRIESTDGIDVIVWPETAIPYYLRASHHYQNIIINCCQDMNATLITGALDYFYLGNEEKNHLATNTMMVFEPEQKTMRKDFYDKIHLVPFGEFTPGGKLFGWLNNMQYGQSEFDYRPFNKNLKMTKDDIPFSPMICYDSVFPHTLRSFCAKGSQYNILITNDIWFGQSVGPYQHAALAIVRSVETRKSMVRSANAGVSMFIDEKGRVLKSLPLYTEGIIDFSLKASTYKSLYVRTGNLFGFLMSFITLIGLIISLWPQKK